MGEAKRRRADNQYEQLPEHLSRRWEAGAQWAEKMMREQGEIANAVFVHGRQNTIIMPMAYTNNKEKAGFIELVGLVCRAEDARALSVITESWVVEGPETPTVRPSKSDQRRETAFQSLHWRDRDTRASRNRTSHRDIIREADGSARLGQEEIADFAGSLYDELIPETSPTPAERRRWQEILAQVPGWREAIPLRSA